MRPIETDFPVGYSVDDAAKKMVELAVELNEMVFLVINGIYLVAGPWMDWRDIVADYHRKCEL